MILWKKKFTKSSPLDHNLKIELNDNTSITDLKSFIWSFRDKKTFGNNDIAELIPYNID